MSTKEKLIERFKSLPSDFTFDELIRLFNTFGFTVNNKGATSGSRVRLEKGTDFFNLHKPHPGNVVKQSALKSVYRYLKSLELL
ncbi:MAG: type II toxin-antitoxin system HicA family toxin [Bacteroidales bacterium]|nr:type II toxin-antitoxin system HicA family toxin [Bacteroidales bacterium]